MKKKLQHDNDTFIVLWTENNIIYNVNIYNLQNDVKQDQVVTSFCIMLILMQLMPLLME